MVKGDNTSQLAKSLPPRSYYDPERKNGYCAHCDLDWPFESQEMYTTRKGTRRYGICPKCRDKRPLRKSPRTTRAYLRNYPPKRIE